MLLSDLGTGGIFRVPRPIPRSPSMFSISLRLLSVSEEVVRVLYMIENCSGSLNVRFTIQETILQICYKYEKEVKVSYS